MNQAIRKLAQRISRLEKAVFSGGRKPAEKKPAKGFGGATGGVRLLISQNFFKSKRGLADVRTALKKNDYHYVNAVIQTALNRQSTRTSPLATFREGGKKMYVNRK